MNISKFLRTPMLKNSSERLLLSGCKFDFLSMLVFIIRHCFLRAFSLTVFMKFTPMNGRTFSIQEKHTKKIYLLSFLIVMMLLISRFHFHQTILLDHNIILENLLKLKLSLFFTPNRSIKRGKNVVLYRC